MFKKKEKDANKINKLALLKQSLKWRLGWYTIVILIVDFCAVCCFTLFYGPWSGFRDWLITTAMSTTSHQYLAYAFYGEEDIKAVVNANKTIQSGDSTNTDLIKFVKHDASQGYSSIYEQQVLENPDNADYKMVEISDDNWKGWMVVIYEPTKLDLAIHRGYAGDRCTTYAKRYKSNVVVNGGIFYRASDQTVYPAGTVISNGTIINEVEDDGNIIGINKDGVLCLITGNTQDAIEANLQWACEMSPFLIVNGVKSKFVGNGGYGVHPRTAIGQRADGIVILLVIDGRQVDSNGVNVAVLADIFERYGCINAANLDGGGSSTLVVEGELVNNPRNGGRDFERYVYDGVYLKP